MLQSSVNLVEEEVQPARGGIAVDPLVQTNLVQLVKPNGKTVVLIGLEPGDGRLDLFDPVHIKCFITALLISATFRTR